MRFNEKLNNIFEISEGQRRFKELYKQCLLKSLSKAKNVEDKAEIGDPNTIYNAIAVLEALTDNNIDVSQINDDTRWEDIEKIIPDKDKEEVLDTIFAYTGMKVNKDFKLGLYLTYAKNAFFHVETKDAKTGKIIKYYNTATDKFFKNQSMEYLFSINFFNDAKKRFPKQIDSHGFIIENCADLDYFYGFNIYTGTKYSRPINLSPDAENAEELFRFDINGFTENGYNVFTHTTYDPKFFKFDKNTKSWVNLLTGKDEDQLGYNHDGIRVNGKYGKVGFDRKGFYHKKLPDGTYSRECQEYDESNRDVYDFERGKFDTLLWHRYKDGSYTYLNNQKGMPNCELDEEGYRINGFNLENFNRDGINRLTGTSYNENGIGTNRQTHKKEPFPIKQAIKTLNQKKITEFLILNSMFGLQNKEWFKQLSLNMDEIYEVSEESKEAEILKYEMLEKTYVALDKQIDLEAKKRRRLTLILQGIQYKSRKKEKEEDEQQL